MRLMLKASVMILGSLFFTASLHAQDFEELLKGNVKDANYLVEGYLAPVMKGFSTTLGQGWYQTAKVHQTLGFDLTISAVGVMIPSSDKFFTVDNTRLETLTLTHDHDGNEVTAEGSGKVPTVFGPSTTQSQYDYKPPLASSPIDGLGGFDLKEEIKVNFLPLAIYSVGVGLPKNFELKFRFMPTFKASEYSIDFFGVGIMHDVKQYIPGLKMVPFDLSAFVGYTQLSMESQLDQPSQTGNLKVSSTTIQGLISKKIGVLTLYGGAGYDIAKSTVKALGYYDLNSIPDDGPNGSDNEAKDPVNLDVSSSGVRATGGLRLKFAFFTLHGDYTFQKYNTFTAGFGFAFR